MRGWTEQLNGHPEGFALQCGLACHKQARIAPAIRALIAVSLESTSVLACRYGVTLSSIYKWKKRDAVHNRSHTAQRLHTP